MTKKHLSNMRLLLLMFLCVISNKSNGYEYYYLATGSLNIRSGPSSKHDIIGALSIKDSVQVILLKEHGWSYILTNDGVDGYVLTKYITKNKGEIGNIKIESHKDKEIKAPEKEDVKYKAFIGFCYGSIITFLCLSGFKKKIDGRFSKGYKEVPLTFGDYLKAFKWAIFIGIIGAIWNVVYG